MSALIEFRDVCKTYHMGDSIVRAADHISMKIQKGEFVAIVGQSGSGKSTCMNIIGCLDVPTSGTYLLGGQDVGAMDKNELAEIRNKKIGFVFQSFHLLPRLSAVENVALPLLYAGVGKKERRARAVQALKTVGLGDRLTFQPDQLSGGQCQRVAIARAMVTKPQILLADEPTGALDSASGQQILELFSQLHQDGATILMITHDASVAEHAQTRYCIHDGILTGSGREG